MRKVIGFLLIVVVVVSAFGCAAGKAVTKGTMVINYNTPFKKALQSVGYDHVDRYVNNKNYPTVRKGTQLTMFRLFDFKRAVTTKDVITAMDKENYRPATAMELINFNSTYPSERSKFGIVSLGSCYQCKHGKDFCTQSYKWDGQFYLSIACKNKYKDPYFKFLGIRKDFRLTVNYDQPLADVLKVGLPKDFPKNIYIRRGVTCSIKSKDFPSSVGKKEVEIVLFGQPSYPSARKEIVTMMKNAGYQPAGLREILALYVRYKDDLKHLLLPYLNKTLTLEALGTQWQTGKSTVALSFLDGKTHLSSTCGPGADNYGCNALYAGDFWFVGVRFKPEDFELLVNYDQPLTDAIKSGSFSRLDKGIISENFPSVRKGKAKIKARIFHFKRSVHTKQAIARMKKEKYRPATLRELIAFKAQHPDKWGKFDIVALGSFRNSSGRNFAPVLDEDEGRRNLTLYCVSCGGWGKSRFLAIRK